MLAKVQGLYVYRQVFVIAAQRSSNIEELTASEVLTARQLTKPFRLNCLPFMFKDAPRWVWVACPCAIPRSIDTVRACRRCWRLVSSI